MERKQSSGFPRIFTEAFCPACLEAPTGAINRIKATVKIRRNPLAAIKFFGSWKKTK